MERNINNESFPYFLLIDYLPKTLDVVLKQQKKKTALAKITMRTKSNLFERLEYCALGVVNAMEYLHSRGGTCVLVC
jgi:hypothetical protein